MPDTSRNCATRRERPRIDVLPEPAADALAHSARLQALRAKAGTGSDGEALEAERQAIEAQLAEVNARAGLTLAYVGLTKSLGLGWKPS